MLLKKTVWLVFVIIFISAGLIFIITELKKSKGQRIDRIILITIDTLRADHLGCYGYPRQTTPFIDTLAREGILFRSAFAHLATTAPSHASIFTSLYPLQHNVLHNHHRLNDSFLTMAEVLSTMGYQTAAFVSAVPVIQTNLRQGFDVFDGHKRTKKNKYRDAKRTVDAAINWLDQRQSTDRFFLWIHLYDPHKPLRPPESFHETFRNKPTKEKDSFVKFLLEEHHIDFGFYGNKTEKMLRTINAYDGEILYADTELQRLHKHFQKKELNSHSLWILTSDHGEGLGNHRWDAHGKHIYNEQIRVPLIFYFSSGAFLGLSIDQIVEHVDILPTVMELVDGKLRNQVNNVQGVSLVPLFSRNQKLRPIKKYAFAQRREYDEAKRPKKIIQGSERIPPMTLPERTNYEDGEKFALQDSQYKYIYRTEGEDEFYDLRKDPYELNNIIGRGIKEENELRNAIILKIEQLKQDAGAKSELVDKEAIEQLKALGYIR